MKEEKPHNKASCLLQIIACVIGGIVFCCLLAIIFLWPILLGDLLETVKPYLEKGKSWKVVGLAISAFVAILLHQLKTSFSIAFGLIEIAGGLGVIYASFNQTFEDSFLWALAIGGGIFLFINGWENILLDKRNGR
jgi:hypothetical protein